MHGVIPAIIQDEPSAADEPPLLLIHDGGGTTINYYFLGDLDRPIWGIANETLVDEKAWPGGIKQLAGTYLDLIRSEIKLKGPVILGGWSVGGLIALEMARQAKGIDVLGVIMIDTFYPGGGRQFERDKAAVEWGEATTEESKEATLKSLDNSALFAREWLGEWEDERETEDGRKTPKVILLRAKEVEDDKGDEETEKKGPLGWGDREGGFFSHVLDVPGHHYNLFADQNVDGLSEALGEACILLEDARDE